jgi:hypothetical protein
MDQTSVYLQDLATHYKTKLLHSQKDAIYIPDRELPKEVVDSVTDTRGASRGVTTLVYTYKLTEAWKLDPSEYSVIASMKWDSEKKLGKNHDALMSTFRILIDNGYIPLYTEYAVGHPRFIVKLQPREEKDKQFVVPVGAIDIICVHRNDPTVLVLVDVKTIPDNGGPIENLLKEPYAAQLEFYYLLLEIMMEQQSGSNSSSQQSSKQEVNDNSSSISSGITTAPYSLILGWMPTPRGAPNGPVPPGQCKLWKVKRSSGRYLTANDKGSSSLRLSLFAHTKDKSIIPKKYKQ